ncbi:MAG: hypothetical protein AAF570_24815, partial [Bacteroidota bacterium]
RKELSETEAWAQLYPDTAWNKIKFRKMKAALVRLFLEFLGTDRLQEDRPRLGQARLEALNALNEERFFIANFMEVRDALLSQTPRPEDWMEKSTAIALEQYRYQIRQPERRPQVSLQGVLNDFERNYATRKMQLAYFALNHIQIMGQNIEMLDIDLHLSRVEEWAPQLPPESRLYLLLYRINSVENRQDEYEALRAELPQADLPSETAYDLYTGLLNYCARRLNAGQQPMRGEIWSIYNEMLSSGILLQEGKILAAHLKNIVSVGARLQQFEATSALIETYGQRIFGDFAENAQQYNHGILYYHMGRHEDATRCLHNTLYDYEDLFYGLDARIYLLRIYFETEDLRSLDSLCDAFRMFLKRNKALPRARKAAYQQFIRQLRRLAHIPGFDAQRLDKLRDEIVNGRRISATAWLYEQVLKRFNARV